MANKSINADKTSFLFYIASGVVAVMAVTVIYILLKPDKSPEKFVNSYVAAIGAGKCDRAYTMLSYSAKKSILEAGSLDRFRESVCDRAANDFSSIKVKIFAGSRRYGDKVAIDFVVHYETAWRAEPIERPRTFELRWEGGGWKLCGLEISP
ncbi:MAG TPA: hypothetical protein PLK80_05025 [bacterium]|nr:hypothetical protein [bacterium]HPI76076.1 hypothetical protein [bacterium]HPN95581.1 hypothetical protein [bacterium]